MSLYSALIGSVAAMLLSTTAFAADDYVILEVGEHKIKKSEIQQIWSGLFPKGQAQDFDKVEEPIRQNVLRGAISEYLLYEEASKAGIDQQADVLAEIEALKRKLIVRAFLESKTKSLVSDDDVKTEYDRIVRESRGKKELRARHILVEDEKTAKEVAKKLEDGSPFEALAKEYSNDPGSKAQGGDLGYFVKGQMVKPFEEAAFELKKDEVSAPVESDFGWHIIKLVDERDLKVATYSEIKDVLRKRLSEERLNSHVNDLVDRTDIRYYRASGKEKELSKTPDNSKK